VADRSRFGNPRKVDSVGAKNGLWAKNDLRWLGLNPVYRVLNSARPAVHVRAREGRQCFRTNSDTRTAWTCAKSANDQFDLLASNYLIVADLWRNCANRRSDWSGFDSRCPLQQRAQQPSPDVCKSFVRYVATRIWRNDNTKIPPLNWHPACGLETNPIAAGQKMKCANSVTEIRH